MTMKDLLEQRSRLVAELRAIADKPEGEGGELSDDQAKKFDTLKAELEGVEKAQARQAFLDEAERRMDGEQIAGSGDGRLDAELARSNLLDSVRCQIDGMNGDAGHVREMSRELERRSGRKAQGLFLPLSVLRIPIEQRLVSTSLPSGGPGSNIVPTDHRPEQFIDVLRSKMHVRRLGARVLNDLSGNVDIPKRKTSSATGWVAENSALSTNDMEFEKVSLVPKHAGAIMEWSRNMIQQSSPDVEQLARSDLGANVALAVDSVAIQGGGSNEPVGILQTTGIGAVEAGDPDGGAITWNAVIDLVAEIEIDDAANTAFLTNPKVVKSARKTAKVASTDSVMIMEGPNALAGFPLASTNLTPSNLTKGAGTNLSALIAGDWSDLLIGFWSELDILVNPFESTAYSKGNVQIRAMATLDLALRHPESFAAIDDLTTV